MTITLRDLPPPPAGKIGWPWTDAPASVSETREDGRPWPKISIVTPSFNQGQFIEETIRSILLQGYPNLEYTVIDGASSDCSVDVIRKYSPWLYHWESMPDQGQAHAINKGLARATGEIFQFINSDDLLTPHALETIASVWNGFCVAGRVKHFGANEGVTENFGLEPLKLLNEAYDKESCRFHQPGIWLATKRIKELGAFKEQLHYCFDIEMLIRYFEVNSAVEYTARTLALFRVHASSKSVGEAPGFIKEYPIARRLLAEELTRPELRKAARAIAERYVWHRDVNRIVGTKSRFIAIWNILFGALRSPRYRFDRFTLGALRICVIGKRKIHP